LELGHGQLIFRVQLLAEIPKLDEPKLKIEDCKLNICSIAREAQPLAPRVASSSLKQSEC